jgi:hypothetical protein
MSNERADWEVHFNIFLKHISHDIKKGLYNRKYQWHNITATTNDTGEQIKFVQGYQVETVSPRRLGSESNNYTDNSLKNYLTVVGIKSTITSSNNAPQNKVETKMVDTKKVVNNVTGTIKTVASQIQDSAITSAKMEAGENILLALRNIVMQKAGFMQKVKFKFAPIALDTAVVVGADILVAELMPNKKSAKLAVECLNLAMTKEIIHALPLQEFTNALTGGSALGKVSTLLQQNSED